MIDINLLFNIVTIRPTYMLQNFKHIMKPDVSYTTLAKLIVFWLKKSHLYNSTAGDKMF